MVVYRGHLGRRLTQVGGQPAPGAQVVPVAQVVAPEVPVDLFHGVRAVPVAPVVPVGLPVDQVRQVGQEEAPGVQAAPVAPVDPVVSPVGQGRVVAALPRVHLGVRVGGPRVGANPSVPSVKSSTICKHRHLVGCASLGVLARSSGYLGEQA